MAADVQLMIQGIPNALALSRSCLETQEFGNENLQNLKTDLR